jgi:hypothetical protein
MLTPSLDAKPAEVPAWSAVLRPLEWCVSRITAEVAQSIGTGERDLQKKLLLHLPRFSPAELDDPQMIRAEAERLACRLRLRRLAFERWTRQARVERLDRASLRFEPCDPGIARAIHERFHYIGTFHEGQHLGVFHVGSPEIPMALATLSPMDIGNLGAVFPSDDSRKRCLVLSRLFAFDWAPRNTISFLMGQLSRWAASELPEVYWLLTYLNPNLGFTGASYQASNWSLFLETGVRYAYLGDDYITYRALMAVPPATRPALHYSQYALQPLKLFRYYLRRRELRTLQARVLDREHPVLVG